MGLVIGVVLIPAGLAIRGTSGYFWGMMRAFLVVAITTMVLGLTALIFAYFSIDPGETPAVSLYGNQIFDAAAFQRAGTMHNFSYLGGMAGIITGALSIYWTCCRQTDAQKQIDAENAK